MTFDYAWAYGRERGCRKSLTTQLRLLARSYSPDVGAPGQDVEGRVIASDLLALAQLADDVMADLDAESDGRFGGAEGDTRG